MPPPRGLFVGAHRCAVCGTFIRQGVVCPAHRTASTLGDNGSRPPSGGKTVEELPLEDMAVPRDYQRELHEHVVRRIVREFDPDLLGLLVVVRDTDGKLWILDGQHRWMAMVELGYERTLCEVLHGVPLARQARIFSGRNAGRSAPNPRAAFRADYVSRDTAVVAIVGILDRYGYQRPFGASRASASRFVCVTALREVQAWGLLEPAVALIRDAWPVDELGTQAPVLAGLAAFLRLYPSVAPHELTARLARHSAAEVLRLAHASHASSRERRLWVHVAQVVVDLYNHGRTANHRLPVAQISYDAAKRWKDRGR
jgi:hypothetical protein